MRSRWLWIALPRPARGRLGWMVLGSRNDGSGVSSKEAEEEMAGGRYRPARQRLAELTKRRPGSSEAAYQLGLCEENLGHPQPPWRPGQASRRIRRSSSRRRSAAPWPLDERRPVPLAEEVLAALPHDHEYLTHAKCARRASFCCGSKGGPRKPAS